MSTQKVTHEFTLDTQGEYDSVKAEVEQLEQAHWTVTLDQNGLTIKVEYTEDL